MRLETARLVIRNFRRSDAQRVFEITGEEKMLKYMSVWHEKKPSAYYRLFRNLNRRGKFKIYEFNRYAIALPDTDEVIGMIGVGIDGLLNNGDVSLAYFMSEKYAGRGFMTECVIAFTSYCFENSTVPYICITPELGNKASERVAEKSGYTFCGTIENAGIYKKFRPERINASE